MLNPLSSFYHEVAGRWPTQCLQPAYKGLPDPVRSTAKRARVLATATFSMMLLVSCGGDAVSTFEVQLDIDDGDAANLRGTAEEDLAWGARITTTGFIRGYLVDDDDSYDSLLDDATITMGVSTSDDERGPGSFGVTAPPSQTHVQVRWEGGFSSAEQGGTITLDTCPEEPGDRLRGSFDDVTLVADADDRTATLSGTFDLRLQQTIDDGLHCE